MSIEQHYQEQIDGEFKGYVTAFRNVLRDLKSKIQNAKTGQELKDLNKELDHYEAMLTATLKKWGELS